MCVNYRVIPAPEKHEFPPALGATRRIHAYVTQSVALSKCCVMLCGAEWCGVAVWGAG
jgi:hypothetical protein